MKLLAILFYLCLLFFCQTNVLKAEMLSDKEQIRALLDQTNENIIFMKGLTNVSDRKFAYAFLQDLKESESRLKNLEVDFKKFDNPIIQDSAELKQLLLKATLLNNHVSAQRETIEADKKSTGVRSVKVTVKFGNNPAPNWRVGYLGENSIGADENASVLIDKLCAGIESRKFYEVSGEAKSEMDIEVVVGWVYLWVVHQDKCAPKSEPRHLKNPKTVDLFAPSEKP
jgi:hypothetical protein